MKVPVEMKRKYLDRRLAELQQMVRHLELNDFEPALRLGHQLKGNAVTFEFPQIAPLGVQIEQAARFHNKDHVRKLAFLMLSEIHEAKQLFH